MGTVLRAASKVADPFTAHPYPEMSLHPILLSGQGIMIGEMLRLNELAAECEKQDRWTFFFSSTPIHIEHGVASPPNAAAIF